MKYYVSFGASEGCVVIENLVTSVEHFVHPSNVALAKTYVVLSGVELDISYRLQIQFE